MGVRQQILAYVVSLGLIVVVIELVRRRKLKERYSFLWLLTGISLFVLALWYDALIGITEFFEILSCANTVFFLSVMFLTLICLHFSVRISSCTEQLKTLAQELALLSEELKTLRAAKSVAKNTTGP